MLISVVAGAEVENMADRRASQSRKGKHKHEAEKFSKEYGEKGLKAHLKENQKKKGKDGLPRTKSLGKGKMGVTSRMRKTSLSRIKSFMPSRFTFGNIFGAKDRSHRGAVATDNLEKDGAVLMYYTRIASVALMVERSRWFNGVILFMIVAAGALVGIQTYKISPATQAICDDLDAAILWVFTLECLVKIAAEGRHPWRYATGHHWKWNVFDFVLVVGGFTTPYILGDSAAGEQGVEQGEGALNTVRLIRLMRLGKLFYRIPELRVILTGLVGGLSSIFYVTLLLIIVIYMYGIMGVLFFKRNDPIHFGGVDKAMLTLFGMATLEDWRVILYINMYGCREYGYSDADCTQDVPSPIAAPFFFISFIFISSLVMLSLFVGVITMSMHASIQGMEEDKRRKKAQEKKARGNTGRRWSMTDTDAATAATAALSAWSDSVEVFRASQAERKESEKDREDAEDGDFGDDGEDEDELTQLDAHVRRMSDVGGPDDGTIGAFDVNKVGDLSGGGGGGSLSSASSASTVMSSVSGQVVAGPTANDLSDRGDGDDGGAKPGIRRTLTMKEKKTALAVDSTKTKQLDAVFDPKQSHHASEHLSMRSDRMKKYIRFSKWLKRSFVNTPGFKNAVTLLIIGAALLIGVRTQIDDTILKDEADLKELFDIVDRVILVLFTAEIVIKMMSEGAKPQRYFLEGWNQFDFLVVGFGYIVLAIKTDEPAADAGGATVATAGSGGANNLSGAAPVVRVVRLLRVLRLLRAFPKMQVIVSAVVSGISSIFFIGVLLGITLYVWSIISVMLFAENDPYQFGELHLAAITLFRCATLDAWIDVMMVNMYGCDKHGYYDDHPEWCTRPNPKPLVSAMFFVVFILTEGLVLLTLFVGVVTTGLDEATKQMASDLDLQRRVREIKMLHDIPQDRINFYQEVFDLIDEDRSGELSVEELMQALRHSGKKDVSPEEVKIMMAEVDDSNNGEIDFAEFLIFMTLLTGQDKSPRAQDEVKKKKKRGGIRQSITGMMTWGTRRRQKSRRAKLRGVDTGMDVHNDIMRKQEAEAARKRTLSAGKRKTEEEKLFDSKRKPAGGLWGGATPDYSDDPGWGGENLKRTNSFFFGAFEEHEDVEGHELDRASFTKPPQVESAHANDGDDLSDADHKDLHKHRSVGQPLEAIKSVAVAEGAEDEEDDGDDDAEEKTDGKVVVVAADAEDDK